jgi:hypothetical protein
LDPSYLADVVARLLHGQALGYGDMSRLGELGMRGWRTFNQFSNLGSRRGLDWLTYNPIVMWEFHLQASRDAPGVIAALREQYPAAHYLADVGAGSGAYVAEATRQGLGAYGWERSPSGRLLARIQGARSLPFDLTERPPADIPGPVDLAYSIEVAEHLSPELGDRLVQFMVGLAPLLLFTAATPGQGGIGHINEQPHEYWHDRFARHGYAVDPAASERLRAGFRAHGTHCEWLDNNAFIYKSER